MQNEDKIISLLKSRRDLIKIKDDLLKVGLDTTIYESYAKMMHEIEFRIYEFVGFEFEGEPEEFNKYIISLNRRYNIKY